MERLDQDALTGVVTSGFSERGKQESFEGWFLAVEILVWFGFFFTSKAFESVDFQNKFRNKLSLFICETELG